MKLLIKPLSATSSCRWYMNCADFGAQRPHWTGWPRAFFCMKQSLSMDCVWKVIFLNPMSTVQVCFSGSLLGARLLFKRCVTRYHKMHYTIDHTDGSLILMMGGYPSSNENVLIEDKNESKPQMVFSIVTILTLGDTQQYAEVLWNLCLLPETSRPLTLTLVP